MGYLFLFASSFVLMAAFKAGAHAGERDNGIMLRELWRAEATALYARVLQRQRPPKGRCTLNATWDEPTVSESTVRKYLRLGRDAKITPAYHGTTPAEVIDPGKKMRQDFCTVEERKKYQGTGERATYSFPLFNGNFQRALIVVTYTVARDGIINGGAVNAEIWTRKGKVWNFQESVHLADIS